MNEPLIAARQPIKVDVEAGRSYWWCVCGRSAKQPFCDGSHAGSGFTPLRFDAERSASLWFCACKRSAGRPLCDGSHKQLPDPAA